MKRAQLAAIIAAMGLLFTATAMAQNIAMPASTQAAEYGYNDYALGGGNGNSSSSDNAPPVDEAAEPDTAKQSDAKEDGKDEETSTCRWCQCGKLADPWTLPQPECLKEHNVTVGGWLSGGIYGNQYGAPSNGPVGLRNVGDGFTMDQVWFYAERKTDTKGCGWDLGGRVDYLFGADAPDTQAFGDRSWDFGWNTARDYGSAMPQLYAEVAYNDLKVKIGHFFTPIGYEVVQSPQNFFYSHSYSHTFGEPFTHTGALAAYQPNDKITYYGGWVDGWDEGFADNNDGSMFLGGLSLNLSEKATLAWYLSAGRLGTGEAFAGAASGDLYYNCFVFTYKATDKWTYVFEHDLGTNSSVRDGEDNQWYQLNNYLIRKLNDCWSLAGRMEWFQDPQGARVSAGSRGNYFALTAGLNYKPHANIILRPEIRYDWFDSFAGTTSQPFNNGQSSSQLAGGFDMIFTY